jgi:hypothetical protein
MTNSKSPLIRDIERDYGSITPVSATFQRDGASVVNDSNRDSNPGVIASNVGMLLILSAQFFAAFMNISVKMLNSLDPLVHALEVGHFSILITESQPQSNRLLS